MSPSEILSRYLLNPEVHTKVLNASLAVRQVVGERVIDAAIVLGSGLNRFADMVEDPVVIPFRSIPDMPVPTVSSHDGKLIFGRIGTVSIVGIAGRIHAYEGVPMHEVVFNVMLCSLLGVRYYILTNAAGGAMAGMQPGSLMLITDHVRAARRDPIGEVFSCVNLSCGVPYDGRLMNCFRQGAESVNIKLLEGVYVWMPGPTYETITEVKTGVHFGVNAFGMSTVPEVLVARLLGMRTVALSFITNIAAGLSEGIIDHAHVEQTARERADDFRRVVTAFFFSLGQNMRDIDNEPMEVEITDSSSIVVVDDSSELGVQITIPLLSPLANGHTADLLGKVSPITQLLNWTTQPLHRNFSSNSQALVHDDKTVFLFPSGSWPTPTELSLCAQSGCTSFSFPPHFTGSARMCGRYASHRLLTSASWTEGETLSSDVALLSNPWTFSSGFTAREVRLPCEKLTSSESCYHTLIIVYGVRPDDVLHLWSETVFSHVHGLSANSHHDHFALFECAHEDRRTVLAFIFPSIADHRIVCRTMIRDLKQNHGLQRVLCVLPVDLCVDRLEDALDAQLFAITDHINLSGWNPIIGPHNLSFGARFVDQSHPYISPLPDTKKLVVAFVEHAAVDMSMQALSLLATFPSVSALTQYGVPDDIVARQCGARVCALAWSRSSVRNGCILAQTPVVESFLSSNLADGTFISQVLKADW
jgi:purine-nucleoside phosphorylase